jgi:hypothetical protein
MISDDQMIEFFNDRLRDYPSSVPASMWDRIIAKKKRDRMMWLFFFRLFALVVLFLGLAGVYFIFNQKKKASTVTIGNTKINHKPFIADTIKANLSNLPSGRDQTGFDKLKNENKKMQRNEKAQITYSRNLEDAKMNIPDKDNSSNNQNTTEALSVSSDSNELEKSKAEYKEDTIGTKLFIQAPYGDSTRTADLKKPETENKPNNRKWFLDLYASPDYPIVSPHDNEKSKLSFTLGVRINRSLGKHFSLKTGIQFSQINIIASDSLFGGMTIHLMRLDLPVLAGYSVGDEKFRTTFNGGAIMNLYSWPQGNGQTDFFKTNTGFSLYLGVNFESRINSRFFLFSEPYYRYQLTSMTVSSVSSMKFIDIVGISIGVRYYFKK